MEEENEEKKEPSLLKEAFHRWFGLFLVLLAAIILLFIAINASSVAAALKNFGKVLRPFLYGGVIAYILNPLMRVFERWLYRPAKKKGKEITRRRVKVTTGLSIVFSMIFGALVVALLLWMIVPQIVTSITSLINNLPERVNEYYEMFTNWLSNRQSQGGGMQDFAMNIAQSVENFFDNTLMDWLRTNILQNGDVMQQVVSGVVGVVNVLYNFMLGIFVAVYLLANKKTFLALSKKIVYAVFKKKHAEVLLHYVKLTHKMFTGFIVGKIVDSAIIGLLCFVIMTLFRWPYPMLISVIVGVFNIIPVFGPYIGAIPCIILILLVNPLQALYFLIMIILIQIMDGNVLGPAILGESIGISTCWVLFAILLFGGLWGIVGMIVGAPLFAIIYRIVADFVNWLLHRKSYSTVTDDYTDLRCIAAKEDKEDEIVYVKYTDEELNGAKSAKKGGFFHVSQHRVRKYRQHGQSAGDSQGGRSADKEDDTDGKG